MSVFAIGDVHGCAKTLDKLINSLALSADDQLVFLGDYVDRGPDSKGVIDIVRKLTSSSNSYIALKGNHEAMMYEAVKELSGSYYMFWMANGGEQSLKSFNAEVLSELDPFMDYIDYLDSLPSHYTKDNFIFAHAGLNLKNEDVFEDQKGMLWIRDWYDEKLMQDKLPGKYIIHGHTPVPTLQVEAQLKSDSPFLNLDTGCVYKNRHESMGYLTAVNLNSREAFFEKNIDF